MSAVARRGSRRTLRRGLTVAGALGVCAALGVGPALAYWSTSGTATAGAVARTLTTPSAPTTGTATASTLVVSGTLPTPANRVGNTTYALKRNGTTTVPSCTLPTSGAYSCTDTGLASSTTYSYTVVATLGAWTATSAADTGTTSCATASSFTATALDTTPTAGDAFKVRLTAKTCTGTKDTNYDGAKTVVFSGPSASPSGKAPTYPASVTFTDGVGTASVTLYAVETTTVTATAGALTGTTSALTVGVTTAEPWTIILTDAANANGAVTISCTDAADLNETTHTCSQTSLRDAGNGRSWSARFTLVDRWGNPQANPGGTMDLTVNSSNGHTRNLSIGPGSATSGMFNIPMSNGSSTINLTATTTNTIPTVITNVTGAG